MYKDVGLDRPPDATGKMKKSTDPNSAKEKPCEIRIDINKSKRHTTGAHELRINNRMPKIPSVSQDYAYVNPGFVGSTNSVNHARQTRVQPPIDTVYLEQYCICSRWPITKKALAIAVGLLVGAAVGLTISMTLKRRGDSTFDFPLLHSRPD